MKNSRYTVALVSLFVLLMSITWTDEARANVSDRKTEFSINLPVRAPGNVVLPPGSYTIKVMDYIVPGLVTIMDKHEMKVYTTFFATAQELRKPVESVRVIFGFLLVISSMPLRFLFFLSLILFVFEVSI